MMQIIISRYWGDYFGNNDRLAFRIVHLSKRTWYDTLGQIFPLGCHLLNIPYSSGGLVRESTIDRRRTGY